MEAVPVEPEWRTDLMIDGSSVEVLRKRIVDHEFGSKFLMLWRRDGHSWLWWMGMLSLIYSIVAFVRSCGAATP